MQIADLIQSACIGREFGGQHVNSALIDLADGSTLYCRVALRGSNSRGARRGRHDVVTFSHRPMGEQYSKSISKEAAVALLEGSK